jgi:hypothetical protein
VPLLSGEELDREINAHAQVVLDNIPRLVGKGYQGPVKLKRVIAVIVVEGDDGNEYQADPPELADGHPDLFFREYVRVGRQKETTLGTLFARLIPAVIGQPTRGGLIDALKGLFGR